eukprot:scaffold38027_cov221-Amphora_coffeaeformis.AAC.1
MYRKRRQQRQQWRRRVATTVVGMIVLVWIASRTLLGGGDKDKSKSKGTTSSTGDGPLTLTSPAFLYGDSIPVTHARNDDDTGGNNTPPPLVWSGKLPPGTTSFALIVDDPDAPDPAAPKVVWVHWVLYNIPVTTATPTTTTTGGTLLPVDRGITGLNDWKLAQYDGPSPPIGRHRYFFKLYALDVMLQLENNNNNTPPPPPTKAVLEQAMQGHILGMAELMGTYQK